ncbi:lipocalin family protein [Azoarcus sp. PA01]|nr:lipocalin family protein [Azoarcus sp. PA01]
MLKKWPAMLLGTCVLGLSAHLAASPAADDGPLATIASLDVPRYMGRWYEIAKYPNRFQKKCVGDTTAEYSLQPDGNLHVINRCRIEDGQFDEAIGAARQIGDQSSPKLEVRFAPAWLSFIPAVWGDYWVIDLDPDYQVAVVSEPKREYLWILSRSPKVSPDVYDKLLQRLRGKGFDTRKLEMTLHAAKT